MVVVLTPVTDVGLTLISPVVESMRIQYAHGTSVLVIDTGPEAVSDHNSYVLIVHTLELSTNAEVRLLSL
jgi:hypothetical protein